MSRRESLPVRAMKGASMHSGVLVAYATRYGSTREIAEAIGSELRRRDEAVDVLDVTGVDNLDGYKAVVLGSALYMGSMLKSAKVFLEQEQVALGRLPVAVFGAGPIKKGEGLADADGQLDEILEKTPWLHPVARAVFVGKYDPGSLALRDRIIAALPASPLHGEGAHDDREWESIAEWAGALFTEQG